jgi:hypothetical protein
LNSLALTSFFYINWDAFLGLPEFVEMVAAIKTLKNQSVVSTVLPFADAGTLTEAEHNAMHDSRTNSDVSFPHSFLLTPVHAIPNDYNSKIIAYIGGGFAWDFALRYLLPDNVEGIIVEIKNTCNQSSLYELVGHEAFYLGENATKESKFRDIKVVRDLSFGTHPNFTLTPGHCQYTIVRTFIAGIVFCTRCLFHLVSLYNISSTECTPKLKISKQLHNQHSENIRCSCCIYVCVSGHCIFHL